MTFFNEQDPDKYSELKKVLVPRKFNDCDLMRVGLTDKINPDGSYVVPIDAFKKIGVVVSYGIGNNYDFEQECIKQHQKNVFAFDGQVDSVGNKYIVFIKENLSVENFDNHVLFFPIDYKLIKMDVEGCEWNFLDQCVDYLAKNYYEVLCVEFHSLIEEVPEGWVLPEEIKYWKGKTQEQVQILEKILQFYDIVHMHANNHGPRYMDFPDSIEITFLKKQPDQVRAIRDTSFPIKGLDLPNFHGREDYHLNWWL